MVPLQSVPAAVAVTVGLFALFLAVTAHVAARSVLGDAALPPALAMGALVAGVAFLTTAVGVNSFLGIALALVLEWVLVERLHGVDGRLAAYVVVIHAVVTVILGAMGYGLLALYASAPV